MIKRLDKQDQLRLAAQPTIFEIEEHANSKKKAVAQNQPADNLDYSNDPKVFTQKSKKSSS